MSVDSRDRSGYHGRMSDDDSQTARGDAPDYSVTFVASEGVVTSTDDSWSVGQRVTVSKGDWSCNGAVARLDHFGLPSCITYDRVSGSTYTSEVLFFRETPALAHDGFNIERIPASNIDGVHFVGITGTRETSAPIRLSIPGELHFEILGTPTAALLAQYARAIESLIVIAEFAAEERSKT